MGSLSSQLSLGALDETHRLRFGAVQDLGQKPCLCGGAAAVRLVSLGGLDRYGEDETVAVSEAPWQRGRSRGHKLYLEDDFVGGGMGGRCLPITHVVNLREGTLIIS